MRDNPRLRCLLPCLLLCAVMACLVVRGADAEVVTFSGTITYDGSYAADTLYVAVMDTSTAGEDPNFIATGAWAVGPAPFSQPFTLTFDNAAAPNVIVAAALDVDGGGLAATGSGDIVGWYASTPDPALVPTSASRADLDFFLPRAEIRGTVTFAPDQVACYVSATPSADCQGDHFAPMPEPDASGPYVILGLYAGTYCVGGEGFSTSFGWLEVCYGDPQCVSPTLVTVTGTQVVSGVDLDFSVVAADERTTWGAVKSAYR